MHRELAKLNKCLEKGSIIRDIIKIDNHLRLNKFAQITA